MIQGNVVQLVAIEFKHLEQTLKWLNDPENILNLTYMPFKNYFQQEKWFKEVSIDDSKLELAIITGKKHVGQIALHKIDYRNRKANIVIFIGKEYWRKGYAKDAVGALERFAFNILGLHKLYTTVYESNKSSIKLFESCGFKREGKLVDEIYWLGSYQTILIYSKIGNRDDIMNHL